MRFGSAGAQLMCRRSPRSILLRLDNFPHSVRDAGLVFADQDQNLPVFGQFSHDVAGNSYSSIILGRNDVNGVSDVVVQFGEPHQELRIFNKIPVVKIGCPGDSDGDGGDVGGDYEIEIRTSPVASACGVAPTGTILAHGALPPEAVSFSLELIDPRVIAPVVIASGSAEQFAVEGYAVPTIGLPGEEGQVVLRAVLAGGEQRAKSTSFPLDHTSPALGFAAPAPGSRVCNVDGMGLDGFVTTDTAAFICSK